MLKIITAPNEVLSIKANSYTFKNPDSDLGSLLKNMEKALLSASDPKGVGLAAPQVGKSYRIFMAKPTENSKTSVFINPEIIEIEQMPKKELALQGDALQEGMSGQKQDVGGHKPEASSQKQVRKLEGCLSLPNIWGEVERAPWVTVKYQTPDGKMQTQKFKGFMATIVQHEMDHLEGILFPKRVLEQGGRLYKSHKDEKGKDVFEELEI